MMQPFEIVIHVAGSDEHLAKYRACAHAFLEVLQTAGLVGVVATYDIYRTDFWPAEDLLRGLI